MPQKYFVVFLVVLCCFCGSSSTLNRSLLDAIRDADSEGNVCALGDGGGSLGAYQIMRQHYQEAIDANRTLSTYGQEYEDLWGEGSIQYSEQVLTSYVSLYATSARLGHVPTDEDIARIHHGGPDGWRDSSTLDYWRRVSDAMNLAGVVPNNVSSDRCSPGCRVRQCCDKDEEGVYRCFCLQAKVNNRQEYVKRPCENCSHIAGIDIVFVLDSSGSIGATNFQKIRNFVDAVVKGLEIGPTRTQVGVIVFSSSAQMNFSLSTYSSREELSSAISGIPYIERGTDTAKALYLLMNEGFVGARPKIEGVPQIAIVVTDGQSNEPDSTVLAAQALKQVETITTYAVGIGNANVKELKTIASVRNGENLVRYISSFDLAELERLQEDLNAQACTASTNVPVEEKPMVIQREIKDDTKVYLEVPVPEDGFTVKIDIESGRVAVCGSNFLERPDCCYSLTYDWWLEVSQYSELFIGADGYPEDTTPATNHPSRNCTGNITNISVYVTVEGLETNNIFMLNTSHGDTTVTMNADGEKVFIVMAATIGIGLLTVLVCLLSISP